MEDIQIKLSLFWGALMLSYLLGDVLRIFSGDFVPGEMQGKKVSGKMWMLSAVLMVIPIVMVILTLVTQNPFCKWANFGVAIFFFIFNLMGLPTYPGAYDKFLCAVGLVINVLIAWTAWGWV